MTSGDDGLIGTWIGGYRVVRQLGTGAMGVVYLAENPEIHRRIAVKVLLPAYAGHDKAVRRFYAEARSVSEINHPNIVKVIDFNRLADGTYYLVMEHIEGVNLRALLDQYGALSLPLAVDILAQIADGLHGAHEKDVVHRDIKPDNIMVRLSPDGQVELVKLLDFGIAKLLRPPLPGDDFTQLTVTGALIGTPKYMSPEQCRSDSQHVGPGADIYALGVIAHECLAGRPPFVGHSRIEYVVMHTIDPVPPIPELADLGPSWREAERVILRCLAKRPEDRFSSAAELAAHLRALPERCQLPDIVDLPTLYTGHSGSDPTLADGPAETLVSTMMLPPPPTRQLPMIDTLRTSRENLQQRLAEQGTLSTWWRSLSTGERHAAAALFFLPSLILGIVLFWLLSP